eukprot:5176207-Amphidinium_carterae.1
MRPNGATGNWEVPNRLQPLPPCKTSGTFTWMRRNTCGNVKQTLQDTRHLTPTGTAERDSAGKGQQARHARSGVTRSSLPTVEEEEACNAFLTKALNHPDFELHAYSGRTAYMQVLSKFEVCERATFSENFF